MLWEVEKNKKKYDTITFLIHFKNLYYSFKRRDIKFYAENLILGRRLWWGGRKWIPEISLEFIYDGD